MRLMTSLLLLCAPYARLQYGGPLLAALLTKSNPLSRRLDQLSAGKGLIGTRRAGLAQSLSLLATKLSDARMLLRFAGLFPIISWMLSLERPETAPADRTTRNVQRLQVWSMLAYYPAEHICAWSVFALLAGCQLLGWLIDCPAFPSLAQTTSPPTISSVSRRLRSCKPFSGRVERGASTCSCNSTSTAHKHGFSLQRWRSSLPNGGLGHQRRLCRPRRTRRR